MFTSVKRTGMKRLPLLLYDSTSPDHLRLFDRRRTGLGSESVRMVSGCV